MMKRSVLYLFIFAALLASEPQARAEDDNYPVDSRIKILRYDPNDIYTIYTLYGYQTNVEFSRNEDIQTISVGDRSLWQIIPSGNRIFIRPMDDDVATNMTVITNRHTYQFDIKSGHGALKNNPHMVYVARFAYPENTTKMAAATAAVPVVPVVTVPAKPQAPLMTPPPAAPIKTITPAPASMADAMPKTSDNMQPLNLPLNYLYTYTGPDTLAPVQVYDDGRATFLRFEKDTPEPLVFLVDNQGKLKSTTPVHKDGFLIVNAVVPRMVLSFMDGSKKNIYLYNEAMNPEDIGHGG